MKIHRLGSIATAVACLGMVLSQSAMAAAPAAGALNDVALRAGGLLVGQVVDQQGVAKAGMPVSIQFAGKEVAKTTTDKNGVFAAQGLRGGQYQLVTPTGGTVCRLWAPNTAPPSARPAALVVSGNQVVRGQGVDGGGPMHSWVGWVKTHPYITAGTVAAAVAIPIALADDDFDHGS
ncbi:MAG TPA: carboxypeptidase-like regulatory domain-containing protein [Lacipirellulaceae bacterium]|nr:carboxypeptidase-like regulatory domain-containing protein [Lacipirellulaceae bacterium]